MGFRASILGKFSLWSTCQELVTEANKTCSIWFFHLILFSESLEIAVILIATKIKHVGSNSTLNSFWSSFSSMRTVLFSALLNCTIHTDSLIFSILLYLSQVSLGSLSAQWQLLAGFRFLFQQTSYCAKPKKPRWKILVVSFNLPKYSLCLENQFLWFHYLLFQIRN